MFFPKAEALNFEQKCSDLEGVCSGMFWGGLLYLLYTWDSVYVSSLRPMYAFVRAWM